MPQTVFDVGDPITSRLKLGVTPDGSTQVSITVTRPDGTAITPPVISAWANTDEKTAQWYATDDGTAGGATTGAVGDWLATWRVTGTGANVAAKVYNVAALPTPGLRAVWSPPLSKVADHVPYLTVDVTDPGSQTYLGTFTGNTSPNDEVAQRHIDAAAALVTPLAPSMPASLYGLAGTVTALYAAASLASAYARTADDAARAAALLARASTAYTQLSTAIQALADGSDDGRVAVMPVWSFPPPYASSLIRCDGLTYDYYL